MIATLKEKASHETESLTKMLSDYFMAVVLTSDTSHANGNLAFVTTKNKIFFMFFTSQFNFLDDIFTSLKLMIKENKDKRILHSKPQNHKHVYLINQNSKW
jgi:hypothetical protein